MEFLSETLSNNFWGIVLVSYLVIAAFGVYYRLKDINKNVHHNLHQN